MQLILRIAVCRKQKAIHPLKRIRRPGNFLEYTETEVSRTRAICPGGVGFETGSATGDMGAVQVAKLTRLGLHGVSVRMFGIRLGLPVQQADDKHGNANGENWAKNC
jgi:hypothetical protein